MNICAYLCHIVGEHPQRVQRFHPSSVKRLKASALAIHIPIILWGVTGYLIATQIFRLDGGLAAAIALFCAGLIYLVERLVLATPKVWYVNLGRVLIGVVIALIGASTVDLVIFDREVTQQLRETGEARIKADYEKKTVEQTRAVAHSKADWIKAQDAANCEANGTCGSKVRSIGPVYRELAKQAQLLRAEYAAAQARLNELAANREQALVEWQLSSDATEQAGLLARIEALHQYTTDNPAAFVAWLLFFSLVLFFELMVVLVKLVFGETVDDRIDMIREQISQHKAAAFMEAMTSPVAGARLLLDATSC